MNSKHIKWNAELVGQLDRLTIPMGELDCDSAKSAIVEALQAYGFALLTGLSASNERDVVAQSLRALSEQLGTLVPQSPRGEKIEDVRDYSDVDEKDERGYRSRGELSPHSDPATIIVLHCLRAAQSGGESHIVNVRAIHDSIGAIDNDLLHVLYQGFPQWEVDGQYGIAGSRPATDRQPVFSRRDDTVSCVLYRPFIEMAATALGETLGEQQTAALDLFDNCAKASNLALRFYLQPGQTLLLHNRTVLHARTDYADWPEQSRRRHLLRVWIDAPDLLPVAPEHELGDLFSADCPQRLSKNQIKASLCSRLPN